MAEEMEGTKPLYRNSKLFSHDFLEERLPYLLDWQLPEEELKAACERLCDLFAHALPATAEAGLEEELIRPILNDILGFSYLVQPSTKIFKTYRQPDYALFLNEEEKQAAKAFDGEKKLFENALAVADAKAWEVSLDAVGPASQMHDYILISGVRWGVITNGRRWRLYQRETVHELDTFYEVDLEKIVVSEDLSSLKSFLLFFRAQSFVQNGFLDHVLTESVEYARRVGAELKENVFEALRLLCQGFLDGNQDFSAEDLSTIHENALILLYRVLFLLYAESERERELLPLSDPDYREQIGLYALKREVASREDWLGETHSLWTRLQDLCHLIYRGSERLEIYEYNGGLFDPQQHPFLERYEIGDQYLAEALKLLTCTQVEGHRGFLDYSALDVRELGSIYEGLLEHKLIAREGELTWEKDKSQRKKTGSYYTPEYIVSYIVGETLGPLVDELQEELKDELANLAEKIRRARGENRKILQEKQKKLLQAARARVLDLKVLDPAMGSGHFLVTACDYLARRIAELEAELTGEETEEAAQELKRTVAVRCLYGVDLNPLATELAKLSLWLHTVAKGKPLSFLDHHLRTGNSLIGATVKDLERPPSGKAFEIGLWESKLVQDLGKAIPYLTFIKESPSDSRSDIDAKKEHWELVNAWIGKYKQAANVWLSAYFDNTVTDTEYQQALQTTASGNLDPLAEAPFFREAQAITAKKRFFHWELEFPDVFFNRFGLPLENPGFDAVIGNPPYVRQEQIKENKGYIKTAYETYTGVADLYVYFYEKSHCLLRQEGLFGMITSNKFMRAAYGEKLRSFLAARVDLKSIIDFGDLPVFPGVSAYPCVVLTVNSPHDEQTPRYLEVRSLEFDDLSALVREKAVKLPADAMQGSQWTLASRVEQRILHKMKQMSLPLADWLGDVEIRRGVLTGFNQAFFIDAATRERLIAEDSKSAELIKPLVVGDDIKRYEIDYKGRYLIFTRRGVDIDSYPAIKNHLQRFKEQLTPRPADWDEEPQGKWPGRKPGAYKWYEIQDSIDYHEDFVKRKIIYPVIARKNTFALDEANRFSNDKTFIIPKADSFCLAFLNSSAGFFWARNELSWLRGGFLEYRAQSMANFPIRRIAFVIPPDERARLVEEGKRLYQGFLKNKIPAPILDLVERCLPKDDEGNFIQEEEKSDAVHDLLAYLAEQMIELSKQKQKEIKGFLKWIKREWKVDIEALALKTKLKEYHKHGFDEMLWTAKRNKKLIKHDPESREFQERLEQEWEASMKKLRPLKEKIPLTDNLIDQIVYKLYGLTEEEIKIVEGI